MYVKFTESDIENMLSGKYSSVKSLKTKQGKSYKAKFEIVDDKVERVFVNKKNK